MKSEIRFLQDLMMKMDGRLDDIADIQAKQEAVLAEHIKRSEANEQAVEELKKMSNMVLGACALITLIGTLVGIYAVFKP